MIKTYKDKKLATRLIFGIFAAALVMGLTQTSPAGAYRSPNTHNHRGWVKHTILEQFGVTATETYLEATYSESDSQSTFNMAVDYPASRCYHSAFPVWTLNSCTAWTTNGWPWAQAADIEGKFSHTTQVKYTMRSYFQANGDGARVYSCWLSSGSLPPFWKPKCTSGLKY